MEGEEVKNDEAGDAKWAYIENWRLKCISMLILDYNTEEINVNVKISNLNAFAR